MLQVNEYLPSLFLFRIDIHFVIKIADFGLSEDMYAKNYFRQSDKDKSTKLPVKWMAPESLTDGLFSEKSDVVRLPSLFKISFSLYNYKLYEPVYEVHRCSLNDLHLTTIPY